MKRILGVDQCGAIHSSGNPKSLHGVVFERRESSWSFEPIKLNALSHERISELTIDALALDSVIGLPQSVWPFLEMGPEGIWKLFRQAAQEAGYGQLASEKFFKGFLVDRDILPSRLCEELSGANSVFKSRPFQKNIQTGTFRSWKDLGKSEAFLNLWPFETRSTFVPSRPWLFEVYPSLIWRIFLKSPRRQPQHLKSLIQHSSRINIFGKSQDWRRVETHPDLADAFVAGYALVDCLDRDLLDLFPELPRSAKTCEGWIFGVKKADT